MPQSQPVTKSGKTLAKNSAKSCASLVLVPRCGLCALLFCALLSFGDFKKPFLVPDLKHEE